MEISALSLAPLTPTAPARLYAFLLRLRPLQAGTLMPFSGELVHGAWLRWLREAAPDVAAWLHDGNRRRLFTCSSLLFPLPPSRVQEAERENYYLALDPDKVYMVRVTLLLGDLFSLFYDALMRFHAQGSAQRPFMQIGRQVFALEGVSISEDDPSGWVGAISLSRLIEEVRELHLNNAESLRLEFASLTTFNRSVTKQRKGYGVHYARLPLPHYLFPNLIKRWEDIAPPAVAGMVQRERIEQYIQDDGIIVIDYDLKTHHVQFTTHQQQGFIGSCKYALRGPDEAVTPEAPLTVRQQLLLLARLSFYCGVGYKTSMGMGRTRPFIGFSHKRAL